VIEGILVDESSFLSTQRMQDFAPLTNSVDKLRAQRWLHRTGK
jgi:hypothetical protein